MSERTRAEVKALLARAETARRKTRELARQLQRTIDAAKELREPKERRRPSRKRRPY
jgi:hypothetical protein